MSVVKRLPEVRALSSILPKGTEGGKEFARILDLLLFYDGRRNGKKVSVFSDAAGDYRGLDSFEGDAYRKDGLIGYQYKFYPSPFTDAHRKSIAESLKNSSEKHKKSKIQKWILITPDNLIESGVKKGGGDVTWFENLRTQLNIDFEIEHWGHKQIISLFLETPSLCLYYYPELVQLGTSRKKTISETKIKYDDNLLSLYKNIEFVGMSIYKQDETKGVPMEDIYIPLKVIPETVNEQDVKIDRINPAVFLQNGSRTVILGDPGSGKSTLLRFLCLSGISDALNTKYKTNADPRLSIVVTLRRYADELKSRRNLSLLDFIQECINADFTLKDFDINFLDYYLETAQAIILFDGLDELPDSNFKQLVRNRIKSLITTFPGNTIIVTSRIVGYENPFRFDDKEFNHYKVAKLRLPEMQQFVQDWYKARMENENEIQTSVKDLIKILSDEGHTAIRELAENPLLLTIVALVHRIDAVLPDQRVVLYQKCTETLLNTWHTWKFRDTEVKNRGKVERRNRRRMESIAHWMHRQSTGTGRNQRSIVPSTDLLKFLTNDILANERLDYEEDAQDLASDFLDFIKKRAGLLLEVGDEQFSFVHLTFQEYLTSSYLITSSETQGIATIWEKLQVPLSDSRWYEVIRLLVAGLKSDESQELLLEKILEEKDENGRVVNPLLLGGILLDDVNAADERKDEILTHLIWAGAECTTTEELRSINSFIQIWKNKDVNNEKFISNVFLEIWKNSEDESQKFKLSLFFLSSPIVSNHIKEIILKYSKGKNNNNEYLNLFFGKGNRKKDFSAQVEKQIQVLNKAQYLYSLTSPYANFLSAALQSVNFTYDLEYGYKKSIHEFLITLSSGIVAGPYRDHTFNTINICKRTDADTFPNNDYSYSMLEHKANTKSYEDNLKTLSNKLSSILKLYREKQGGLYIEEHLVKEIDKTNRTLSNLRHHLLKELHENDLSIKDFKSRLPQKFDRELEKLQNNKENFWDSFQANPILYTPFLDIIIDCFNLEPKALWFEALRITFLPKIPLLIPFTNNDDIRRIIKSLRTGKLKTVDAYFIS